MVRIITVFGSSRPREDHADYEEALSLGRAGFAVCGGAMEAVSRGVKEAGGKTFAVTAAFFPRSANDWIDTEICVNTCQQRLFELVRLADGYVACQGGTGTLLELAVVWERLNKSVIAGRPLEVLGEFCTPILERVREVELGRPGPWGEANGALLHTVRTPGKAAEFLRSKLS